MKKFLKCICLVVACFWAFGLFACATDDFVGISDLTINESGELIITYTDNKSTNLGQIQGANGQDGTDGVGIKNIALNGSGELIITYTDNKSTNLGQIQGANGQDGTDGVGIKNIALNGSGELIITCTDNKSTNLGQIQGANGQDGTDGVGIKNVTLNNNGELLIAYTNGHVANLGSITDCKHNNFSSWATARDPDCVTHGYKLRRCSDCGYIEYLVIDAVGHSFDLHYTVSEPTCTKDGLDLYICSVCHMTKAEISEQVEHVFEMGECINCGLEKGTETLVYEEVKNVSGEVVAYSVKELPMNSDETDIVIPSLYNNKPVTKIASLAFACQHSIKRVKIGKNIVEIGDQAFYDCPLLETVYWNATACEYAGSIDCPIFDATENIKNIYIGDGVTRIPDFAFMGCGRVQRLTLTTEINYIGAYAFVNMISLRDIYFDGAKDEWTGIEKGNYWNVYVRDCIVHCKNGDMELPVTSFD